MTISLHLADCLHQLAAMPDACVDAVVTDPPYGLAFMGKDWDSFKATNEAKSQVVKGLGTGMRMTTLAENRNFQEWNLQWATECLRVLKPGGWLLAFSGSRTYHRLACAVEEAGFEVRDQLLWIYATGFPKSLNLKGEWAGWGTALKPAHEPIVMARKPLIGTVAANVLEHGTGALNIDGCRVGAGEARPLRVLDAKPTVNNTYAGRMGDASLAGGSKAAGETSQGRWPTNLLHDGSESVQSVLGDAVQFFYCPKASKTEKDRGCDDLPISRPDDRTETGMGSFADKGVLPGRNSHPTVKPVALMRYLCRLVTPPGGIVLDPFMGSGSTGIAALQEGFNFIGIEREPEYLEIARRRITAAQAGVKQLSLLAA